MRALKATGPRTSARAAISALEAAGWRGPDAIQKARDDALEEAYLPETINDLERIAWVNQWPKIANAVKEVRNHLGLLSTLRSMGKAIRNEYAIRDLTASRSPGDERKET